MNNKRYRLMKAIKKRIRRQINKLIYGDKNYKPNAAIINIAEKINKQDNCDIFITKWASDK